MNIKDLKNRREALSKQLDELSFSLLFSGIAPFKLKDQNYHFAVNRNFYYLTGLERENFTLLILRNGENHFEFLFIEEPSEYATKWLGSRMTKEEANAISGIPVENILYTKDFKTFLASRILMDSRVALSALPENLYLDMFRQNAVVQPAALSSYSKVIESYPELRIKDANKILDELRRIKSKSEVEEIKKAIRYTNAGIKALQKAVKPGMNERELDALFAFEIRKAGSEGNSFSTIMASGKNATVLHYEDNNSMIEDNTLVLDDLGALSNNYAADITRTYPANGKFTERQKQYYELVLHVNKTIIGMVKPGVDFTDLNKKANALLVEGLMKLGKIKEKSELSKYYYHSIGHYLGLDVHDVGTYKKPLEPGVVITVEPGLYISEESIGIRIEDNILVTKDGYINLSKGIIKEVKDIEEFMEK